jgi:hypothetical protein
MQIEQALGELGHLADTAGDGDARHGMGAPISISAISGSA